MSAKDIRNIVLLGHSGSGKTTLAERMLFLTGGTDRLGRIADGNTTCDYDPEEIRRQTSISPRLRSAMPCPRPIATRARTSCCTRQTRIVWRISPSANTF